MSDSKSFVHLHVHTDYSMLDGAAKIKDICAKAAAEGAPAVAMTDHGVMYGAMEFYKSAKAAKLTPIIGVEAYVAPGGMQDRSAKANDSEHITLLAQNQAGYRNLVRLVSAGWTDGFYYKPRIDLDLMAKHSEGIICLSGCISGLVAGPLVTGDYDTAKKNAEILRQIYGDRFYLEIMRHKNLPEQDAANIGLVRLSQEMSVPLVATNDSHYTEHSHAHAQDVMICIGTGKKLSDPDRMKFSADDYYVKSPTEMRELFADMPEACDATVDIAARIEMEFPGKVFNVPTYEVPAAKSGAARTPDEFLKALCYGGLKKRYGAERVTQDPALTQRLDYELGVIKKMGFSSYFLIVWDFIKYARDNDVPVGPGRGSAAGSLVAYTLRITDLDPIKYGLHFERFLNPDRVSMPDIDTDFGVEGRDKVIKYVVEKYGRDKVAQIVTIGVIKARQALKDAGRVMDYPLAEVERMSKLVPNNPGDPSTLAMALGKVSEAELARKPELAYKRVKEMMDLYARDPRSRDLLDTAMSIEGYVRNAGTHAAGVVIADKPLTEFVPLVKIGGKGEPNVQFDGHWVEDLGLLKMDFLGLRNLDVIKDAVDEIRRSDNPAFDVSNIPERDAKTFEMLARGATLGVFQLEGDGMSRYLAELRPSEINDLVAMVALYRPGPMELIPQYIGGKLGTITPSYIHPKLESILGETHGIAVYQEQVMQIAREIAGFTPGEADELRKVMGKKLVDKMPIYKEKFVSGAEKNGVERALAGRIFEFVEPFAGYGFNKAHAAAYGWIAYQTAYLKANHPRAYFAALMTSVSDNTDKLVEYIEDGKKFGARVAPPDVNESRVGFTVAGENIRFGLGGVKGVGDKAIEAIIGERTQNGPFTDIYDFVGRVSGKAVNKKVIETLVKCGACDALGGNRAQQLAVVESAIGAAAKKAKAKLSSQESLFGAQPVETKRTLPEAVAPSKAETLAWERETLGIFVSGHPLDDVRAEFRKANIMPIRAMKDRREGERAKIGGLVTSTRVITTKKGDLMMIARLEDHTGASEIVIFPKQYERCREAMVKDGVVFVEGRIKVREIAGRDGGEDSQERSVEADSVRTFRAVERPPAIVSAAELQDVARSA